MSSRGRRRHGSTQVRPALAAPAQAGPAQLGWALLAIAAAVIGGLAAAALVHASVVVAVIVSVVVGGIGAVAVFRSPGRPPGLAGAQAPDTSRYPAPRREAPPAPGARAARPASYPPDPVAPAGPAAAAPTAAGPAVGDGPGRGGPPAPDETVVQLLPLPSQPGAPDTPWWDSAQAAPAPSPGAKRAPAPDLSTYLAATFIAQCPRCGGFRLDIRRGGNAWDFRCESCEYAWTWQPGTSWPPVRVMPP